MSAAFAQLRGTVHLLHPRSPAARRAWGALVIGAIGLLSASRFLDHAELGDRLFAAMWLLFAASGLHGLRQASWTPRGVELAALPIRRGRGITVEIAAYTALILTLSAPFVLLLSARRFHRLEPWNGVGLGPEAPLEALGELGVVTLLLLPLLAAAAPGDIRRGPLSLLRILLPWLPLGVAASAGWLADPRGLGLTVLCMSATAAGLLALRRTGWEAWWPRLPDWFRPHEPSRVGLAHPERLETDFRDGLSSGLGLGVLLLTLAWATLWAGSRGLIAEGWLVLAMLLLAAAWLCATQGAMAVPWTARIPAWRPETIPWTQLPLPHGAMQRRLFSSQAIALLALGALQILASALICHGLTGGHSTLLAVDIVNVMLMTTMPVVACWEARFTNSPRPPAPAAWVLVVVLGTATVLGAMLASFGLAARIPWLEGGAPLGWLEAWQRVTVVHGPAALLGLAWLAIGQVMVTRDVAAQRRG